MTAAESEQSSGRQQPSLQQRHCWLWALSGAVAMAAVQPPVDLWWAAWLAPIPWLQLARAPVSLGRRDWLAVWCGGVVFWLAVLHWLRLPHPATSIGWVVLAAYLG